MFQRYLSVLAISVALLIGPLSILKPAIAQTQGAVPGTALGIKSDSDFCGVTLGLEMLVPRK